jgi:hypothetical protein
LRFGGGLNELSLNAGGAAAGIAFVRRRVLLGSMARARYKAKAPALTGNESFERACRVQMNDQYRSSKSRVTCSDLPANVESTGHQQIYDSSTLWFPKFVWESTAKRLTNFGKPGTRATSVLFAREVALRCYAQLTSAPPSAA